MKYIDAVEKFEEYQRKVLNRSENTIKNYKLDILQFAKILGITEIDVSKEDIEKYAMILSELGLSESSRARKITAVQVFYRFLADNELIEKNPVARLSKPKIPQKKVLAMTENEVKQVIQVARSDEHGANHLRNLVLLSIMLSTGIRRNELVNIRVEDVSLENHSILVREGKGNKQRIVYYNDTTRSLLSKYLAYGKNGYLFQTSKSKQMCVETVNNVVNDLLEKAGLKEKGYTVHSLRRAFATMVYNNTKDIMVVQNLLGHTSPQTTMRYVGINEETKQQAAQLVNF